MVSDFSRKKIWGSTTALIAKCGALHTHCSRRGLLHSKLRAYSFILFSLSQIKLYMILYSAMSKKFIGIIVNVKIRCSCLYLQKELTYIKDCNRPVFMIPLAIALDLTPVPDSPCNPRMGCSFLEAWCSKSTRWKYHILNSFQRVFRCKNTIRSAKVFKLCCVGVFSYEFHRITWKWANNTIVHDFKSISWNLI